MCTGLMGTSTVEQLLENVCLLLASRTRDVVKSALGFIKVAVVVMDVVHLAKHVQLVVRRHFLHWVIGAPEVQVGTPRDSGHVSSDHFHYCSEQQTALRSPGGACRRLTKKAQCP